jgi:hypothetical protein
MFMLSLLPPDALVKLPPAPASGAQRVSLKARARMIDSVIELARKKMVIVDGDEAEELRRFRARLEALAEPGLHASEIMARLSTAICWDGDSGAAASDTGPLVYSRFMDRHIRNNAFSAV